MQLSKSEYMMFLKHPAWLWLKKHDKSKIPEPDANLQAIFDAGHDFEKYAEKRFKDLVVLGFDGYKEYLALTQKTKQAIESGAKAIAQGRFEAVLPVQASSITCICDVLENVDGNNFDLYEIKSSTKVKPEHYHDLAFQVVVLESAGLNILNISVIHVNSDYVRQGEVDPKKLSAVTVVTEEVRDIVEETKKNIEKAFAVATQPEMPDPSPRHLSLGPLNEWMQIYKNIKDIDEHSIYNLIAPGAKRLGDLEDMDVQLIKDIPEDFNLTSKQLAQVQATKNDNRIVEKDSIKDFLATLTYPLYFLDYETAMGVVPLFDGTKPYQQIPFQYSLHIVEKPGGEPRHVEYLHKESTNPVPPLLAQLKNDIGDTGNILVWYKSFEMKRNEEMAEMYPEYAEFLVGLNERTVDLMEPFSKNWFVDKDFFGSSSIKYVLPVVVPELTYKDLTIQEGGSAQRLWVKEILGDGGEMDKEKLHSDLVEYCKLDTLAMVRIWQELENLG